jgi:hypothetical protein
MSNQDDFNLERWTSSASASNYTPDFYRMREETRLDDIKESYKLTERMERPRLDELKAIRTELQDIVEEVEEDVKEEKIFLFDPKELDI